MELENFLLNMFRDLGVTHIKKMFGWMCILIHHNFFAGYKILDDNIIIIFLVLSTRGFAKAIKTNRFQKFEFGKTWVEIELNDKEDINFLLPFLRDARKYALLRNKLQAKNISRH